MRLDARSLEGIRRSIVERLDEYAATTDLPAPYTLLVEPTDDLDYVATLTAPEIPTGVWGILWEQIKCPCCSIYGQCKGRFRVVRS